MPRLSTFLPERERERSNDDQFQGIDRFKHAEIQFLPQQNDRLTIKQSFEISFPSPPAANLTSAFEWRKNLAKSFWGSVFWGVSGFMTGPDLTIRIEMDLSSVSAGCWQWGVLSHRCDLNTNQRIFSPFSFFCFLAFSSTCENVKGRQNV